MPACNSRVALRIQGRAAAAAPRRLSSIGWLAMVENVEALAQANELRRAIARLGISGLWREPACSA